MGKWIYGKWANEQLNKWTNEQKNELENGKSANEQMSK